MRRRAAPEPRPHHAPYASVALDVPTPDGADRRSWTFRIPRWGQLAEVEKALGESEGHTPAIEAAFGRLFALSWADEDYALDADPLNGTAVFDELYDAGWPQSLLYGLAQSILARARSEIVTEKEVRERTDFFGANGVSHASMSSGSPSSTSSTSSPSMT